ncbi:MAG: ribonuclease Z [Elusimicrobia bacterium]|nr:ribonuclease Z [Elusimicrobiota bacterium]
MIDLIVLGSGGFALDMTPGRPVRHPPGYAVRLGDRVIVLDLGFGNLRQMARAGLDPARVTDIFLTHLHPDHAGDLAAILFFFRYERPPRAGYLRLFGPPGFKAFLRRLDGAYRPWLKPSGYRLASFDLAHGGEVQGAGWAAQACRVPHPAPSLAYRLSAAGRSLVYTGDTGWSAGLARFARGCDLLVLECSMPDRRPRPGVHLTVSEALDLVRLSGCRKAVFSHLTEEAAAGLRERLRGRRGRPATRLLARDLMRIRV